jgi:transcriptional regulator with XRE-family HTH domain
MQKRLNTSEALKAMESAGLTQALIAQRLDVSREAVSQWFNHKSFPRPDKLLKLGKLLSLAFGDLVIKDDPDAPVVAFRRMRGTRTKDHHVERAQDIGRILRHLVPYLPFDTLAMPPVLKAPVCDYEYLQIVARKVREEICVDMDAVVDFVHLIRRFADLQAVLVPVLWGSKQRHENAMHIYLPDSRTTWVYLNLDVNIHDFKFWMAHELGHCLSPSLRDTEAEDFADAFASALLFPREQAEAAYIEVSRLRSKRTQLERLAEIANRCMISPNTIYKEMNRYAERVGKQPIDLEPDLYKWTATLNKQFPNVSEIIFGDTKQLTPKAYIEKSKEVFDTSFFDVLSSYLREHGKGAGIVQMVLDAPLLDAQGLHAELT